MSLVNRVVRELDPRHDLDRVSYQFSYRNSFIGLLNIPKHGIRGGVLGALVGAVIGTLVGMLYDSDIPLSAYSASYAILGMPTGSLVDMLQYS